MSRSAPSAKRSHVSAAACRSACSAAESNVAIPNTTSCHASVRARRLRLSTPSPRVGCDAAATMPEQFGTAACSRHTFSLERGQPTEGGPARLAAGLASQRKAASRRSSSSTQGLSTGSKSSRRGVGGGGRAGGGDRSEVNRGACIGCLGARVGRSARARRGGGAVNTSFCSSRGAGCHAWRCPYLSRALSQRLPRSTSEPSSSCSALRMRQRRAWIAPRWAREAQ
jgi:hypothetical protein